MPNRTRYMSHHPGVEKVTGARGRTLEWSGGPEGVAVVAITGMLVIRLDGWWRGWGWDEVFRGEWRKESSVLLWGADGERLECVLDSPGELLLISRERVLTSTVMTINHDLPRGAAQIIARRNLLDGGVTWLASANDGASLEDPGTAIFVVAEADRLRSGYELRTVGSPPVNIILIRHVESANNKTWMEKRDRALKVPDSGLTELGRIQTGALAGWFPGFTPHPTQLFSSPFMRALETAAPLVESLGTDMAVRADLVEHSGPFAGPIMEHHHHSGSPRSVLQEVSPRTVLLNDIAEEGQWKGSLETYDQVIGRAKNLVTWLHRDFDPDDYVILVSRGVIGSLLVTALFCPSELTRRSGRIVGEISSWFVLDNTPVSWFQSFPGDDTELCCFGCVDHLVLTGAEGATIFQPS